MSEEYFKTAKYGLSLKNFHSNTLEQIKQEIYTHQIITTTTRILEDSYISHKKISLDSKKTNFKNNINKMCESIAYHLLYSFNDNKIMCIMKNLFKYLRKKRPGRSYVRKSIIKGNKWYRSRTAVQNG